MLIWKFPLVDNAQIGFLYSSPVKKVVAESLLLFMNYLAFCLPASVARRGTFGWSFGLAFFTLRQTLYLNY